MRRFPVQVTRVGVGPDLQPLLVVVRVQPGVEVLPARSTVRTATIRAVRAAEADHGAVQPGCTGPTQVANTSPIC